MADSEPIQPDSPADAQARPVDIDLQPTYGQLGRAIGELVTDKQRQYGDSVGKTGRILAVMYPDGIAPHQYDDALLVVRILDKLCRVAQRGRGGKDLGGESPYADVCGYSLMGWRKDEGR